MTENKSSFWTSLTGILTSVATILGAITALYIAISNKTVDNPNPKASSLVNPTDSEFNLQAKIVDPDGYTNIRSETSAKSQKVGRINEGEIFYTYNQPGSWWKIKTKDGMVGYIHSTRLRVVDN